MDSKITLPYLSKYEYAALIAKRAQQISENSPITIKERNSNNPIEIAKQEFKQKTIPLKIIREIGGKNEVWNIKEMRMIHHQSLIEEEMTKNEECAEWEDEEIEDEPKKLSKEEINEIVNGIKYREKNSEVLELNIEQQRERLRNALKEIRIKPSKFKLFKDEIHHQFFRTIVSPGEAVGVNSAQCIGEPVTQGTLNTFHSAGQSASNVTLGFGRATELFNATSNPSNPLAFVYFKNFNQSVKDLYTLVSKYPCVIVNDVLQDWNIYSITNYPMDWWVNIYLELENIEPIKQEERCLRIYFDIEKLYTHKIQLQSIKEIIENEYQDVRCIPSPLNLGIIDIYVNCELIDISKLNSIELNDIQTQEQAIQYYMHDIVRLEIKSLQISGIHNISYVHPRNLDTNQYPIYLKPKLKQKLKTEMEWMIETIGTNLIDIFKQPYVDVYRTYSNDFMEMYSLFGIEAARTFLLFEFTNIVSVSGGYINPRHVQILVDKMTHTGEIRAIARYGIETSQYGPISRASFEEVMKHLITSASFSEVDHLNSISSNVALGVKIRAGTGYAKTKKIPMSVRKKGVKQIVHF